MRYVSNLSLIVSLSVNGFLQIRLSELLGSDWKSGAITDIGSCAPPDEPVRSSDAFTVVAPGKEAKRGKGGTLVRAFVWSSRDSPWCYGHHGKNYF